LHVRLPQLPQNIRLANPPSGCLTDACLGARAKEKEEDERRDVQNQERAAAAYTPGALAAADRTGDLSGLPWGGMPLSYMTAAQQPTGRGRGGSSSSPQRSSTPVGGASAGGAATGELSPAASSTTTTSTTTTAAGTAAAGTSAAATSSMRMLAMMAGVDEAAAARLSKEDAYDTQRGDKS
jgi:hypothetical protein